MKVLFLLKKNHNYNYSQTSDPSTGLFNSATILARQLQFKLGIRTKLKICHDANSIDREIHQYHPDICIIEAIWVTPTKMNELVALHPKVKFIVRIHSELPFLANEGSALEFIGGYEGVKIGFNSYDTYQELKGIYDSVDYLPNLYDDVCISPEELVSYFGNLLKYSFDNKGWTKLTWGELNVGCFGAIRPMKNQLIQAVAAINFADRAGVTLNFHMNGVRIEQKGDGVLKNLISLFEHTKHNLIFHPWLSREDFLELISTMDVGLQVSMNESFNIVTADFVKQGVPIVVSEAVKWCPDFSQASTIYGKDIEKKIGQALKFHRMFRRGQKLHLSMYNQESLKVWADLFGNME